MVYFDTFVHFFLVSSAVVMLLVIMMTPSGLLVLLLLMMQLNDDGKLLICVRLEMQFSTISMYVCVYVSSISSFVKCCPFYWFLWIFVFLNRHGQSIKMFVILFQLIFFLRCYMVIIFSQPRSKVLKPKQELLTGNPA